MKRCSTLRSNDPLVETILQGEAKAIAGCESYRIVLIQRDDDELHIELSCWLTVRSTDDATLYSHQTQKLVFSQDHPQFYRLWIFLEQGYVVNLASCKGSLRTSKRFADPADFIIVSWVSHPYLLGEDTL
jgi:hypothetical protein